MLEIKTLQEYDDILDNTHKHNKQYMFINFYANWCGPCTTISPLIYKWSKKYNKNTVYYKIDVDNSKLNKIIKLFKINCMPTFVIFDKIDPVNYLKIRGAANKESIENMMKKYNK